MNKEEFIIDEKIYENHDGSKIKIVFSNLGRRYKKIGEHLYLMLEKEELKLEDKLTAMVRIEKENEEIDRKKKIEKNKQQTTEEIRKMSSSSSKRTSYETNSISNLNQYYITGKINEKEYLILLNIGQEENYIAKCLVKNEEIKTDIFLCVDIF